MLIFSYPKSHIILKFSLRGIIFNKIFIFNYVKSVGLDFSKPTLIRVLKGFNLFYSPPTEGKGGKWLTGQGGHESA